MCAACQNICYHTTLHLPDSLVLHCTDWSKQDWAKVKVLLKCGTGKDASTKQELQVGVSCQEITRNLIIFKRDCYLTVLMVQDIWPHLTNLKWIHSASAGVEKLLFPELIKSKVVVTNAKASAIICTALLCLSCTLQSSTTTQILVGEPCLLFMFYQVFLTLSRDCSGDLLSQSSFICRLCTH